MPNIFRQWPVLLGAVAALAVSADCANAQYYPRDDRYGGYERYDRYDQYRRYRDPRYDAYDRRSRYFGDPREQVKQHKPKRRAEPKEAEIKPAKGPYIIVVALSSQRIYLYGDDGLIRESRVSTGMHGHTTPAGIFSVIEKDYYHRSNIYSGAPMPLMQRITWSGVALHEGVLPGYPASHGCIRMNGEFAKFLWHTTQKGARVIVARSEIAAPVPIESPKLFVPITKPIEAAPTSATTIAKEVAKNDAPLVRVAAPSSQAASISDQPAPATPSEALPDARITSGTFYKAPIMPGRKGTVTAFISRKTSKLYVRYAYEPLFQVPVEIKDKDQPIGTHVYTAMEPIKDGKEMKWTVTSVPTRAAEEQERKKSSRHKVATIAAPVIAIDPAEQTAAKALARVEIPKDAAERIGGLLTRGASLTISDYGISEETGDGTDFIILTR